MSEIKYIRLLSEATTESEIDESTKLIKYGIYKDMQDDINKTMSEARKLEKDDSKKAISLYKEAKSNIQKYVDRANKIPDNDFSDWIVDIFLKPWPWLVGDIMMNSINNGKLTDMSKTQALQYIKSYKTAIDKRIKNISSK